MQMRKCRTVLWTLAVLVPLLCVLVGELLFLLLTHRVEQILREPMILVLQSLIAASPFVALATLAGSKASKQAAGNVSRPYIAAALVGFVVTIALWGLYYYDGYVYWRDEGTGGANIGLGILMLVSPVIVTVAMRLTYRSVRHG
jgi:hypothetical protein